MIHGKVYYAEFSFSFLLPMSLSYGLLIYEVTVHFDFLVIGSLLLLV
jgi:hypothetical protein